MKIGEFAYVLINAKNLDVSTKFWSSVLGREVGKSYGPYVELSEAGKVTITLQLVSDEWQEGNANTHIDIKVDNLEEAVRQVKEIGGRFIEFKERERWRWAVMSNPDGNIFCLV